jgi:hypothetical protein
MKTVIRAPGLKIRPHESILYNSRYPFDEMHVNAHVVGKMGSFGRVWESAPFRRTRSSGPHVALERKLLSITQ